MIGVFLLESEFCLFFEKKKEERIIKKQKRGIKERNFLWEEK